MTEDLHKDAQMNTYAINTYIMYVFVQAIVYSKLNTKSTPISISNLKQYDED